MNFQEEMKELQIPIMLQFAAAWLVMKLFVTLVGYLLRPTAEPSAYQDPAGPPAVVTYQPYNSKADRSWFDGILNREVSDAKAEKLGLKECMVSNDLKGMRYGEQKTWKLLNAEIGADECVKWAETSTSSQERIQRVLHHFRFEEPNGIQKLAAIRAWTCTEMNYLVSSCMHAGDKVKIEVVRPVLPYLRLLYDGLHALGNFDPEHFIYRGPMYRGETGHYKTPKEGEQVLLYCLTAFSKDPRVAQAFSGASIFFSNRKRTVYAIEEGCGYDISDLSKFKPEAEVLAEGVAVLWAESGTGFHSKVGDMHWRARVGSETHESVPGLQIVKTRIGEGSGMLRNSPLREVERSIIAQECARKVELIMQDKSCRDALSLSMKLSGRKVLGSYHHSITTGMEVQHDIQPADENTRARLRDLCAYSSDADESDDNGATYEECLPCLVIAQQSLLCLRGGTIPIRSGVGSGQYQPESTRMKSISALNTAADGWSLVWRNLRSASMQNMGLQSIPARLLELHYLTALDLGGNELKWIPSALQDEMPLVTLKIDVHKLQWPEIIKSGNENLRFSPRGFSSLQNLSLRFGSVDKNPPPEKKENPSPMSDEAVGATAKWLDTIGSGVGGLKKLSISYSPRMITTCLSKEEDFSGGVLTNLRVLILNNVGPRMEVVPAWLEALSELEELDISDNDLTSLPVARQDGMSAKLETLKVSGNKSLGCLGGLENLSGYTMLTSLNASYVFADAQDHATAAFVSHLPRLKVLSMKFNNKLPLMIPSLGLLPLRSLDLTKSKTPFPPEGLLTVLSSLRSLKMGMGAQLGTGEQILDTEQYVPQETFLHTVLLDGCNISSIPSWLWSCYTLSDLQLSHDKLGPSLPAPNGVALLPAFSRSLTRLCLCALGLTAVPSWVLECDFLQELQLGGSSSQMSQQMWPLEPLEELPEAVCRLSSLTKLSIKRSSIRSLPNSAFSQLQALSVLDLSLNPYLKELPLGLAFCTRLASLSLKIRERIKRQGPKSKSSKVPDDLNSESVANTAPTFPPVSVWKDEEDLAQRVVRYMSRVVQGKVPVNLVKVVVLGERGAGKTAILNGLLPQYANGGSILPRSAQNSERVSCSRIELNPTVCINAFDVGSQVSQEHQRIASAFASICIVPVNCSPVEGVPISEQKELRQQSLRNTLHKVCKWALPRSTVLVVPTHPDLYGKAKEDKARKKTMQQLKPVASELAADADEWRQDFVNELRDVERHMQEQLGADWLTLQSRRDCYFDLVEHDTKRGSVPLRAGDDNLKMAEMLLDAMSKVNGLALGEEDCKVLDDKILKVLGRPTVSVVQNLDDLHDVLLKLAKGNLDSLAGEDDPALEVLLLERELRVSVRPNHSGADWFEWDPLVDSFSSQQPDLVRRLKKVCTGGSEAGSVDRAQLHDAWMACAEIWDGSAPVRKWCGFDKALEWLTRTGCIVQSDVENTPLATHAMHNMAQTLAPSAHSEGHVLVPIPRGGEDAAATIHFP